MSGEDFGAVLNNVSLRRMTTTIISVTTVSTTKRMSRKQGEEASGAWI